MNTDLTAPMSKDEVKAARLALGFETQEQLAAALGLEGKYRKDTVRSWESGRVPISGPSRLVLRMMLRDKGLLTRQGVSRSSRANDQARDKTAEHNRQLQATDTD